MSIGKHLGEKKKAAGSGFTAEIYGDLEEFCLRKGKRIRPLMLLIAYLGYSGDRKKMKEVLRLASVLEMMHSFLLVQDDIIDRARLRRGRETMHLIMQRRYGGLTANDAIGTDIALVAADVLFSNALEIISNAGIDLRIKNRFLKYFGETYEMTAWGQILDSMNTMPLHIDPGALASLQISTMKTAYYTMYYPMVMGYVLAGGGSSKEISAIRDFAIPLGRAFQVRDDMLGVFGEVDDLGKSADSDIIEGKLTLLIEYTLQSLEGKQRRKFQSVFQKIRKKPRDCAYIRNEILKSGALDRARETFHELLAASRDGAAGLAVCGEQRALLNGLIDSVAAVMV